MDARCLIERSKPTEPPKGDARSRISTAKSNVTKHNDNGSSQITFKAKSGPSFTSTNKNTFIVRNKQKTKFTAQPPPKRVSIDNIQMDRPVTVISMESHPKNLCVSVNSHRNIQSGGTTTNFEQNEQKINRHIDQLLKSYGHVDFSQQYSLSERQDCEYRSPLLGVKVVVRNLPDIITVQNLYHIFSAIGAVCEAKMEKNTAELVFSTMEEALAVKNFYHRRTLNDRALDVSLMKDGRVVADCEDKYDYPRSINKKDDIPLPSYDKIMSFLHNGGMTARVVSFTVYL